jgi:hypothetical protein
VPATSKHAPVLGGVKEIRPDSACHPSLPADERRRGIVPATLTAWSLPDLGRAALVRSSGESANFHSCVPGVNSARSTARLASQSANSLGLPRFDGQGYLLGQAIFSILLSSSGWA